MLLTSLSRARWLAGWVGGCGCMCMPADLCVFMDGSVPHTHASQYDVHTCARTHARTHARAHAQAHRHACTYRTMYATTSTRCRSSSARRTCCALSCIRACSASSVSARLITSLSPRCVPCACTYTYVRIIPVCTKHTHTHMYVSYLYALRHRGACRVHLSSAIISLNMYASVCVRV